MPPKPIQEQFGETVIKAVADFARADLKTPEELEADEFAHVTDASLRHHLAEVFYGARWLYKLGLALLTRDAERAAHIRGQIVDYASLAEGLLGDCVAHAVRHGHTVGDRYTFDDPDRRLRPIKWDTAHPERALRRRSLWWLIQIAHDFGVIGDDLKSELDVLRKDRNTVHLQERSAVGKTAFLNQSRRSYETLMKTVRRTQMWKMKHPAS